MSFEKHEWYGKPFNSFGEYLRATYGTRVLKLPLDAGFSCPNRDGTLDTKGCVFCSERGSASPITASSENLRQQMKLAAEAIRRTDEHTKYIAYLQAFTNTYASTSELKRIYDEVLSYPDLLGLMIGTRPDCLSEEIISVISGYTSVVPELWLEIGVQSMINESLSFLRRHHDREQSIRAITACKKAGIKTCVHVILGIPGESWNDMMHTADQLATLNPEGIKLHHMHVIKNTALEKIYRDNTFPLLSLGSYVSAVTDFLERIPGTTMIHRLSGDCHEDQLIAPLWGQHKGTVIQNIEDEFRRRGTWQGFLYNGGAHKPNSV